MLPVLDNDVTMSGLCELPWYIAITDGVSTEVQKTMWWKNHETVLPKWSSACKLAPLVQPSSAAAERVFSVLSNSFRDQEMHSLEDYIETSVMLQYNCRH